MIKLTITKKLQKRLEELEEGETLTTSYKGLDCYIQRDPYGNINVNGQTYLFNFICPSEYDFILNIK